MVIDPTMATADSATLITGATTAGTVAGIMAIMATAAGRVAGGAAEAFMVALVGVVNCNEISEN